MLKTFTNSHLKKIIQMFTPVKKILKSFLYREGEPAKYVYIVREGEFKQTIKMQLPNTNCEPEAGEVYENPLKAMKGQNQFFVKNLQDVTEIVEL